MSFGKKSSKPKPTGEPTITPVEQKPTEPIQRAAIAERADTAASPQLLATDDEERRRQAGASLLG